MPHVTVTINGRTYRMACDEGQENHLLDLSERLNGYVSQLKGAFGEIGDQRLTVMAGIMVTDELQELERRVRSLEADLETVRASRDDALAQNQMMERRFSELLSKTAGRLEELSTKLAAGKAE